MNSFLWLPIVRMSILQLKSSLGYIYYSIICFLIQIYCLIDNLRMIRSFDTLTNVKSKENSLILSLIIVSFTIVGSSISNLLNLFHGFGNSIEDHSFDQLKSNERLKSFPLLTLFDIFNGLLILFPKLLINTELIKFNIQDQSYVFQSSIDFLIGNGISRVKKDGLPILTVDTSSLLSCQILNLFLILLRYHFIYSNCFYQLNLLLSLIITIHSIVSMILSILIYSIFEIFFKQISLINNSINIYSYLLVLSLMISILFLLLTNNGLYHYGKRIFIEENNQLVRLSNLDDRSLNSCVTRRSLVYYLLFVMLSVTCQIPFLILTLKYLLSNLIDYLLLLYLTFFLIFFFISILIFTFLCLSPFHYFYGNYFQQINEEKSLETFSKSNLNVEEKLFHIESPRLIPTRSISSSGLTVIDYQYSNGRNSHPTFEQTPGIATDTLLVMH